MEIRTSRSEFPSGCFLIKSKTRQSYSKPVALLCRFCGLQVGPTNATGARPVVGFHRAESNLSVGRGVTEVILNI